MFPYSIHLCSLFLTNHVCVCVVEEGGGGGICMSMHKKQMRQKQTLNLYHTATVENQNNPTHITYI